WNAGRPERPEPDPPARWRRPARKTWPSPWIPPPRRRGPSPPRSLARGARAASALGHRGAAHRTTRREPGPRTRRCRTGRSRPARRWPRHRSSGQLKVAVTLPAGDGRDVGQPVLFHEQGVVVHGVFAEQAGDALVRPGELDRLGRDPGQGVTGAVQVTRAAGSQLLVVLDAGDHRG